MTIRPWALVTGLALVSFLGCNSDTDHFADIDVRRDTAKLSDPDAGNTLNSDSLISGLRDPGTLERAYADALRRSHEGWAEHINKGTAYALPADPSGLDVRNLTAHIEQASLRVRFNAQVWSPYKQVSTRNMERVGETVVSVLAFDATEAEPLLNAACKAQMISTPLDVGDDLSIMTTGAVQLAGIEGSKPFRYGKYAQRCEAYATTVASCREPGGHPRHCTYGDGAPVTIEHTLTCDLTAGRWTCHDEGEAIFPPEGSQGVSDALNALPGTLPRDDADGA